MSFSTRVTVPSDPLAFGVLRAVAASMGEKASLSIEAIEDVCIAVDEAALLLLGRGASGVSVGITSSSAGLTAEASAVGEVGPDDGIDSEIGRGILSALVDELEMGETLRFVKRSAER